MVRDTRPLVKLCHSALAALHHAQAPRLGVRRPSAAA
jgi:hypothetical protein